MSDMSLSRADLEADLLRRQYEQFHPELPIVPQHAFDASLEQAIARNGDDRDLWLFAYGSLIWNPPANGMP